MLTVTAGVSPSESREFHKHYEPFQTADPGQGETAVVDITT